MTISVFRCSSWGLSKCLNGHQGQTLKETSDKYRKCFFKREFAVKLSQAVLEVEDFPFFRWARVKKAMIHVR